MAKKKRAKRAAKVSAMDKKVKKLSAFDMSLVKLASMAFILFVITVWPAAMTFVHGVSWGWWLAVTIILALIPLKKAYF